MTIHPSGITPVENPNLISFKQFPSDELDLSGYLLSPSLVTQLRTTVPDDELDTTTPDSNNEDNTSNTGKSSGSWGDFDALDRETVGKQFC